MDIYYSKTIDGTFESAGKIGTTVSYSQSGPKLNYYDYVSDKGAGYYKFINNVPKAATLFCSLPDGYVLNLPKIQIFSSNLGGYLKNNSQLVVQPNGYVIFKPEIDVTVTSTNNDYIKIYQSSTENGNYQLISDWNLSKNNYYKVTCLDSSINVLAITLKTNVLNESVSSYVDFEDLKGKNEFLQRHEIVRYYPTSEDYRYPPSELYYPTYTTEYRPYINDGDYVLKINYPCTFKASILSGPVVSYDILYSPTLDGNFTLKGNVGRTSPNETVKTFTEDGATGFYSFSGNYMTINLIGNYGGCNLNLPKVDILETSNSGIISGYSKLLINSANGYVIFKPTTDLKIKSNNTSLQIYRSTSQNGNYQLVSNSSEIWNLSKDYYYKCTSTLSGTQIYVCASNLKETKSGLSLVQFN